MLLDGAVSKLDAFAWGVGRERGLSPEVSYATRRFLFDGTQHGGGGGRVTVTRRHLPSWG